MAILLIKVHLLEPLWHGSKDWPPSPFRLFQALVAGACSGRWAGEDEDAKRRRIAAFEWLERQHPPTIAYPPRSRSRQVTSYVPNNDLDAVGGDPDKISNIRVEKTIVPWRLENKDPFVYAWKFEQGADQAHQICDFAQRLHCFGRGVDGAWAQASIVGDVEVRDSCVRHALSRPGGQSQSGLRCPVAGSLGSLIRRHEAASSRFNWDPAGKSFLFRQPSKSVYRSVAYSSPDTRLYFEIRQSGDLNRFLPISQTKVTWLTEELRESAAQRLTHAIPESHAQIERFLTGRSAGPDDLGRRVQIVPIPSIGHRQTSPAVRRIAVLIPPDCPLASADLEWAFQGLPVVDSKEPPDVMSAVLVQTTAPDMLRHYGADLPAKRWRSVTPIALPKPMVYARSGSERASTETQAASSIAQACRHAGIAARPTAIRVQAEPFLPKGEVVQAYAVERFRQRLRHAEITFSEPVRGPLVIGDGRFLGLGLMQPVLEQATGLHVFEIEGTRILGANDAVFIVRILRRAVMARAQSVVGSNRPLPLLFHGHEANGTSAHSGNHAHLFFAAFASVGETHINRLAVIAPDFCDRNSKTTKSWQILTQAVEDLQLLVCGSKGEFRLTPVLPESDPVFGLSNVWRSVSPYRPTRHKKSGQSTKDFLASDVTAECARRAIPIPKSVEAFEIKEGARDSLSAKLVLTFRAAVRGPLLLGRASHFGEGLFTSYKHLPPSQTF